MTDWNSRPSMTNAITSTATTPVVTRTYKKLSLWLAKRHIARQPIQEKHTSSIGKFGANAQESLCHHLVYTHAVGCGRTLSRQNEQCPSSRWDMLSWECFSTKETPRKDKVSPKDRKVRSQLCPHPCRGHLKCNSSPTFSQASIPPHSASYVNQGRVWWCFLKKISKQRDSQLSRSPSFQDVRGDGPR